MVMFVHCFDSKKLIPIMTNSALRVLTSQDWLKAKIDYAVFYLDSLLVKPGLTVLQANLNLKQYYAYTGTLILNLSRLKDILHGYYVIRSEYDGSSINIAVTELLKLIIQLRPDYLVLPPDFMQLYGDYLSNYSHYNNQSILYMDGLYYMNSLWLESDLPAVDAVNGKVYAQLGYLNLLDKRYNNDFALLAENCSCFTCSNGYTRAYLSHILQRIPLLAQRLLILHNMTYYLGE